MIYFENWENQKKQGLMDDFEITEEELRGCRILFAYYLYESYEGDAYVLFKKDNKLYEVNGSHCSCNGLEDQWEPEEMDIKEIEYILKEGNKFYKGGITNEMRKRLTAIIKKYNV